MLLQVSRRAADHSSHLAHQHRVLAAVRQIADTYRNINALLDHAHHPVDQQGIDADLGILLKETDHHRRDVQVAKQHRRGDRQLPTRLRVTARRRRFSFLNVRQNPTAVFQVSLPGLRQVHIARGPNQQLRADTHLQRRHRPSHAGRRQSQPPRRRREALLLGNGGEDVHFL